MNGGIVVPYGSAVVGGLSGKILCIYKTGADATHATTYKIDGGGSRPVQVAPGTGVTAAVGQHTLTFAVPAGDTAPPDQTFSVTAGNEVILKVFYS
ncbi:MAG: hypothetical protein QOE70_6344 [Chthoniobacter sp.]|jgi:hypothetical protein|nr:hypothetical protein [Chthoniobacter sp.]